MKNDLPNCNFTLTMMLPNKLRMAASGAGESNVTLVDSVIATGVVSNSFTATNRSFGRLAGSGFTRHLIAVITCQDVSENGGSDTTFNFAVTIGGVSATLYNSGVGGADGIYEDIAAGVVIAVVSENTLTSGTVAITISNYTYTMEHYGFALYRAINLASPVPTTQPTTSTLVVPSNGFGVMGAVDATNLFGILGAFTGVGAETAYFGPSGAAMLRTTSGSVVHTSDNATIYRGATWIFA